MASHSSVLAWEISWTEEAGGLPFMGSQVTRTRLSDQTPAMMAAVDSRGQREAWRPQVTQSGSGRAGVTPGTWLLARSASSSSLDEASPWIPAA